MRESEHVYRKRVDRMTRLSRQHPRAPREVTSVNGILEPEDLSGGPRREPRAGRTGAADMRYLFRFARLLPWALRRGELSALGQAVRLDLRDRRRRA